MYGSIAVTCPRQLFHLPVQDQATRSNTARVEYPNLPEKILINFIGPP